MHVALQVAPVLTVSVVVGDDGPTVKLLDTEVRLQLDVKDWRQTLSQGSYCVG